MRALILNCTLKRSPEPSNTQWLADVVAAELAKSDVEVESSVAHRVLERMDAMLSETDDQDRPSRTTGSRASWSPATRTVRTT